MPKLDVYTLALEMIRQRQQLNAVITDWMTQRY